MKTKLTEETAKRYLHGAAMDGSLKSSNDVLQKSYFV